MTLPPDPLGSEDWTELAARLRLLRAWSGTPYRALHRQVVRERRARGVAELPSYSTVFRCFQGGRSRMDAELVTDIASVLLGDRGRARRWRDACAVIAGQVSEASVVSVATTLPLEPGKLIAREAELEAIMGTLGSRAGGGGARTVTIDGMAGVGKSHLAIHAAHALHRECPFDLILTTSLRGYSSTSSSADPAAVLDAFLRQVDARGERLAAADVATRRSRLEAAVRGRRVLVLLDDASSTAQVTPLLLQQAGVVHLVTSRSRLRLPLPTSRRVALDVLTPAEAMTFLTSHRGAHLVHQDRASAEEIVTLSGHLPLALAVVMEQVASRDDWTLEDHVERLVEQRSLLTTGTAVDVALGASFHALPAAQRRLLTLIAASPCHDLDVAGAAATSDVTPDELTDLLGDLVDAHLVLERRAGRFTLHDLVRLFVSARAGEDLSRRSRRLALNRLFTHYTERARGAMALYDPPDDGPSDSSPVEDRAATFGDLGSAVNWLDSEIDNILTLVWHESIRHRTEDITQLAMVLSRYLERTARFAEAERLLTLLTASPSAAVRAKAWTDLAVIAMSAGRHETSLSRLESAAHAFQQDGDLAGECRIRLNQGGTLVFLGRFDDGVEHHLLALGQARELGNLAQESAALGNIAVVHLLRAEFAIAVDLFQDSLMRAGRVGHRSVQTHAVIHLGATFAHLGRLEEAIEHLERGHRYAREIRHRLAEIDALNQYGAVLARLGELDTAIDTHAQALELARESGVKALEVQVLNTYAATLRAANLTPEAVLLHESALSLATSLDDDFQVALASDGLASCLSALGRGAEARTHRVKARVLQRRMGIPGSTDLQ